MIREVLIGFAVGLVANFAGLYLFVFFWSDLSFESTLAVVLEQGFFGKLIAVSAVFNLFAFFIFLKRNLPYRARGVLMATLLAAIAVLILQFFS